jgi:hypothetical protein
MLSFQMSCITLCAMIGDRSNRAAKVGVAAMRQGSPGQELNRDREDRDPDYCRQLPL